MTINANKPHLWKTDTQASVDQFNRWFVQFAPEAYRNTRKQTIHAVEAGLTQTRDLCEITAEAMKSNPGILQMLRMATCPPLARDRLTGLAQTPRSFVGTIEGGKIPPNLNTKLLDLYLGQVIEIISDMRDFDLFPWLLEDRRPTEEERYRSATIVADRLCGSLADPIVRNAQEKRQLSTIAAYLVERGYRQKVHQGSSHISEMEPGTFNFRQNVLVNSPGPGGKQVKIPVDVAIQPKHVTIPHFPILVEAKSAGDFTNVNKRRKEEATKINQLKATFGNRVVFLLFLCGYFDAAYLGYEAAEGIDWIWEHRLQDLDQLGL